MNINTEQVVSIDVQLFDGPQFAQAIEILGASQYFASPKVFITLDPNVAKPFFSLTAWVEVLTEVAGRFDMVRMPLATNPKLSCWAWAFPSQFRYVFICHIMFMPDESIQEWCCDIIRWNILGCFAQPRDGCKCLVVPC